MREQREGAASHGRISGWSRRAGRHRAGGAGPSARPAPSAPGTPAAAAAAAAVRPQGQAGFLVRKQCLSSLKHRCLAVCTRRRRRPAARGEDSSATGSVPEQEKWASYGSTPKTAADAAAADAADVADKAADAAAEAERKGWAGCHHPWEPDEREQLGQDWLSTTCAVSTGWISAMLLQRVTPPGLRTAR